MNIIVTITEDEREVLDSWLGPGQITNWVQHALDNKVRQRIDASVLEVTDKNPAKMSKQDKLKELKKYKLPTRNERNGIID